MKKGQIFLIPCPLGALAPMSVLPLTVLKVIEATNHYVVEHEKNARRFIKSIYPQKNQANLKLSTINKFTDSLEIPELIRPCLEGFDLGIISDAGCPGVADPGAEVIHMAHKNGIKVVPLVGPSSILLALMASGLNGQKFAFHGYLPIDKDERKQSLKQLEKQSQQEGQTQIFIETPYRNNQLLEAMTTHLKADTQLCVACNLTLQDEFILSKEIRQWQPAAHDLHKRPCIFLFLAK
ncbi:MAG: SAM-dependent methyltransferase [Bacteroidetes bacterium]|nr:SAM-dependent methyltransferase [Bacteroidota bacterium]